MEEDIKKFAQNHRELLLLEREENLQNFFQNLSLTNLRQLEKNGQAFTKLTITNVANNGSGQFQIDLERQDELELNHGLNSGDLILCLRQNKIKGALRGVVTDVSDTSVSIAVNETFEDIEEEECFSLIKTDSDVTYKCQTRALSNLERKDLYSMPCYNVIKIAFGNVKDTEKLVTDEDPIPKEHLNENGELKYFDLKLADDQKSAVSFALKRRHFAIIQGPPGTGKTTTLIELIRQLHSLKKKILVCAPTNVAIDNIAIKLDGTEIKPIRLGHLSRISKHAQKFAVDTYLKQNDGYSVLRDIEQSIKELTISSINSKRKSYKEIRELRKDHRKRLNKLTSEILKNSAVILSTLNSATPRESYLQHLPEDFFDVLIVDEASQAMEASMWIAMPNAKKLVMAGDINQLPPVVMSQKASEGGLNLSLMERVIKKFQDKCFLSLIRQYRMHEKIMSWSSKSFYNGILQADESVKCHLLKDIKGVNASEITSDPLIFIDTCGCDCEEYKVNEKSGSKGNPGEAVIVEKIVLLLTKSGVSPKDIGIITPYTLQVDLIRRSLNNNNTEVSTVDGFQGREKEVIILSLVRSNQEKELGFVTDFRRLNVAVTRARRLLVLIADSETVEKNELITSLLKHIDENGVLQTAEEYLTDANDKKEEIEKSSKKKVVESKVKSTKAVKKNNTSDKHVENVKIVQNVESKTNGMDLLTYLNKERYNVYEKLSTENEDFYKEINDVDNGADDDSVENKQAEKLNKKQRKKKKHKDDIPKDEDKSKENNDFDSIIAEFSKTNYVCSFESCKISTKLVHLACEFCKQWYCLQHGLQEVHGCGEAVRRKERKEFRHQLPAKASKKDKDKFARKLKELEDARKPKKKAAK